MAKKFNQFLLENLEKEDNNLHQQNINNILQTLDPTNMVRFVLFCVKSVFNLNDEITTDSVKQCIQLIEKWLANQESVTKEELYAAANNASSAYRSASRINHWSSSYVASAASNATNTVYHIITTDIIRPNVNMVRAVANAGWTISDAASAKAYAQYPNADDDEMEYARNQLIKQETNNYKRIAISFTRKYKNPNDKLFNLATDDPHNQNEANFIFWDYILENDILQHFTEIGDDGIISFNLRGIHLTGQSLNDLENQIINNKELFNNVVNIIRSTIRK